MSPFLPFLKEYIRTSSELLGGANNPILYRTGEKVGRGFIDRDFDEIIDELGIEFTYEISAEKVIFTVKNSFEASVLSECKEASCHMLRGFFAEISRKFLDVETIHCIEIECGAKGDKNCLFIVEEM